MRFLFQKIVDVFAFFVERFRYAFERNVSVQRVQTVRQTLVVFERLFPTFVGNRDRIRQRRVRQRVG